MPFAVHLTPSFINDEPAQGIREWAVTVSGIPPLRQATNRQRRWVDRIREKAVPAYIRALLSIGENPLLKRHWWTPDTQDEAARAEAAMAEFLLPVLLWADRPRDWVYALPIDREWEDPTIVGSLIALRDGTSR